jgi:RNA polymerase sigma-54 factor
MALGPRLDLRQSQSLVMTPQLQQAIRLLALSNLEVESFIAEEIEKNPLLESGAVEAEPVGEPDAEPPGDAADALPEIDAGGGEAALDIDQDSEDFHQDSAVDAMHGPQSGLGMEGLGAGGSDEGVDFDAFAGEHVSLHEHLRHQAGEILSGADLIIAEQDHRSGSTRPAISSPRCSRSPSASASPLPGRRARARRHPDLRSGRDRGAQPRRMPRAAGEGRESLRSRHGRLIDNLDYLAKGNFAR